MSSLDYLELCRLCLVKDNVSVPIFEEEGDLRQIYFKISSCLPVKVSREDKLPKKICDECGYKVELLYQFWNTTANAEKQLLQWLGEVGIEDKQGYVTEVLDSSVMKQERSSDNRLDGSVMQVGDHQNNIDINMIDNISIITMPAVSEQQFTTVPMDTSGTVQTVQAVPGPSTQTTHDQIVQSQTHATEVEEESEEENYDDGCDNEGMTVKEETEDHNEQPLDSTFVNVTLPCDEAGPSGLHQQKISELTEITSQTADGDPKTGDEEEILDVQTKSKSGSQKFGHIRAKQKQFESRKLKTRVKQEQLEESIHAEYEIMQKQFESQTPPKLKAKRRKLQKLIQEALDENTIKDDEEEIYTTLNLNDEDQIYSVQIIDENEMHVIEEEQMHDDEVQQIYDEEEQQIYDDEEEQILDEEEHIFDEEQIEDIDEEQNIEETDEQEEVKTKDDSVSVEPIRSLLVRLDSGKLRQLYQCSQCDQVFPKVRHCLTHARNEHGQSRKYRVAYRCKNCQKLFQTKANCQRHIEAKHKDRSYNCPYCDFVTKNYDSLKMHQRTHTDDYRLRCDRCDKGFPSRSLLERHIISHTGVKPFVCEQCGAKYADKRSLKLHATIHNPEGRPKKYSCELCDYSSFWKNAVKTHMKTHTGAKIICDECGQAVCSNYYLKVHKRIHRDEKPYTCKVCSKGFRQSKNLAVHMRTHTKEKPYKCDKCKKCFSQNIWLKRHKCQAELL